MGRSKERRGRRAGSGREKGALSEKVCKQANLKVRVYNQKVLKHGNELMIVLLRYGTNPASVAYSEEFSRRGSNVGQSQTCLSLDMILLSLTIKYSSVTEHWHGCTAKWIPSEKTKI